MFKRPDPGGGDLNVLFSLVTINQTFCESDSALLGFSLPAKIQLDPVFTAEPQELIMPANSVTITNYTEPGPFSTFWEFGDGEVSNEINPEQHIYGQPGSYQIRLIISDGYCEEFLEQEIRIFPTPPVVDFIYKPSEGCPPLTVEFENLSEFVNPHSYIWDFGDNQGVSITENPRHTYYTPGIYTVSLQASNDYGDTVKITRKEIITVYENPSVDFTTRPTRAYIGEMVYTTNHTKNATEFFWDFGDQYYSNEFEPVHQYSSPGTYDITLYAQTENGCEDSRTVVAAVVVEEGGKIKVPNAFTPDPSGPTGGNISTSGKNDVFYPLTEGVRSFKMYIFNKWGEVIFFTEDLNVGWDGYFNGQLCPQDVYVYKLELEYVNGEEEIRVGDVNLLR
jgi:gliding motility-associated-like protein